MLNPMDLTGQKIVVTGASSGLGRACAIVLSELGASILLIARDEQRLTATRDSLTGGGHQAVSFDFSRTHGVASMLAQQAREFGRIDGMVHAAGVLEMRPIQISTSDIYENMFRVNVVAASQLLRALTKTTVASQCGCSVVLVGSMTSVVGVPGLAAYSTSKAALLGLVRSAAVELAPKRIRVNAVLPGQIETPMQDHQYKHLTEQQISEIAAMHPLGIGHVDDVAMCVAFLLSRAARWMTGSSLVVDGGYTAR